MAISVTNLLFGLLLSAAIAAVAYRARSLSASGAAGAVIVGTLTFGLGGLAWAALLIAFFVSSSALSHYRQADKAHLAEKFAKTGQRDIGQVLANGGWGAGLALLSLAVADRPALFVAFMGAMAAVNADTWATELGVLNPRLPRLVTTGRVVPVGTSGAVSPWGMVAAAGGAFLIGLLAVFFVPAGSWVGTGRMWLLPVALLAGLAGTLFDSILGATVQGIYWCERDGKETEKRVHGCGQRTRLVRGWAWLDNEWVNFLCSVAGSAVAWGLVRVA